MAKVANGDISHTAFFYGTLLHPKILKRVIGNDGSYLQICPAMLLDHTRHKIKAADYPGVIPYARSRELIDTELDLEQRSVRGTLVHGLSQADLDLLDVFEGNEYTRETVRVHPLGPVVLLNSTIAPDVTSSSSGFAIVPEHPAPLPQRGALLPSIECQTYIWRKPIAELDRELWSFTEFVRTNAWKWVGDGARENEDYKEVERRRQMAGNIVR